MAKNFRNGPKWWPGVIVEKLGTLTFLVQLDNGMFWRRHVDELEDRPQVVPELENVTSETDYYDVDDSLNTSDDDGPDLVTVPESTNPQANSSSVSETVNVRRNPPRIRRPPKRYCISIGL